MSYRCQRCDRHCNHRAIKVVVGRHGAGNIASEQNLCSACAASFEHAVTADALTTRVRKAGLAVRDLNGRLQPPTTFATRTQAEVA